MDAEDNREMRRFSSSRGRQQWSGEVITSEVLDRIVRALMRPVMDHGNCFDRDDAGLLEQYLTEAGLQLLEDGGAVPNYAEIGMLLQSYACNYSRKIDHVIHLAYRIRAELCGLHSNEPAGPEASPRRRRTAGSDSGGGSGEFLPIVLTPAPLSVRRAPSPAGPPPSLPRHYSELRPRDPRPDRALYALFSEEPLGSLDDFYVSRRTQGGYLVDELEADEEEEEEMEPVERLSLLELQAAIERNAARWPLTAPPASPPPPASPTLPASPPPSALPLPHDMLPLHTSTPLPTPLLVRKRKLASEESVITLEINTEMCRNMPAREFALPRCWVRRVVRARRNALLSVRRSLSLSPEAPDFRGFDTSWEDIGGFRGWPRAEGSLARAEARRMSLLLAESDDDGFFERSSDSLSPSLVDRETRPAVCGMTEARSWQEDVAATVAAPLDLAALARDVRRALPAPPAEPVPWSVLLASVHHAQPLPSRVLLDVLSKATSGELEVLPGTPGLLGDFSVRLRGTLTPPAAPRDEDLPPSDP